MSAQPNVVAEVHAPLAHRVDPPSRWTSFAPGAGCGRPWPLSGPAFIAAIAYVDPGNVATNIAGGAEWVRMQPPVTFPTSS